MTGAKIGALVMGALLVMYVVLVGDRALALISSQNPIAIAIGALMLVFPVAGAITIFLEFRFGRKIEKLGNILQAANAWPVFDFELRPSGRPTKDSAAREFDRFSEILQRDQTSWKNWFALGLAYDAAGDRTRARKAMRRAILLADKSNSL